jgi:cellulose synthase operon protein YhjQ
LQVGVPESNSMAPGARADVGESTTPEDVASLYSWANLHGAKYRDFSASRALAREEARLRAEEAATAEQRRIDEEAERRAQEEAQIAARLAAEAAEAARQAEADRLAEIARQAEAERQAVLAAQEAQRQAVQQRGWQGLPAEIHQSPLPASAPFAGVDAAHESGQSGFMPREGAPFPGYSGGRDAGSAAGMSGEASHFDRAARPFAVAQPRGLSQPEPAVYSGQYSQAAESGQNPRRSDFAHPGVSAPPPSYPPLAAMPANAEYEAAPFATSAYPAATYGAPRESYPPSPWQSGAEMREEHDFREPRESAFRPAWLAPEIPPAPTPFTPYAPQRSTPAGYAGASNPAPEQRPEQRLEQRPEQRYVPMYAQTVERGPAQHPGRDARQDPGTWQRPAQSFSKDSGPAQIPVDDTLGGSRDRVANRWYALKSVFDPHAGQVEQAPLPSSARVPALAVFSLAGGVGKTSLVASLGRALSARGERVLLVDTAAFGVLPFFFGARDQRPGLLRTFNPPGTGTEAPIQLVTLDPEAPPPDGPGADANPASNQPANMGSGQASNAALNADRNQDWLPQEVTRLSRGTHRILIDLPTASGATTRRILQLAPVVLVPVVPDMHSVVSVGAIESFFRNCGNVGGKQIMPYYVLNQFDYALPLHLDVREILREQIGDRLLPFALRCSPAVSEALAEGMTVMDYAPGAVVAEDYAHLAQWVRSLSAPATQGSQSYGSVRWSER